MKATVKKLVVIAMILISYVNYATETLSNSPKFYNVIKGHYISVTDNFGEVIYNGLIKQTGNLTTLFDFTRLKNGNYTVEINKDFEIEINTIVVNNGTVLLLDDSTKKIFKPVFRIENSKVLISKLALDSNQMTVELYYGETLIYTDNIEGADILNRVYQLDNSLKGSYSAIIRTNSRVYIENFRI
ncbi:hypothetical protein [uncultured Winogradskyella sp.]|uniref:hypothetical protein n=1 Tax=uncultured Winogradskyella sp. TaxID=395353 RepID=UPI0030DBC08C|tara:strand:+ start:40437 stop:40994 length:558 start_codon:yes stop_codon:yes gene_type:complete